MEKNKNIKLNILKEKLEIISSNIDAFEYMINFLNSYQENEVGKIGDVKFNKFYEKFLKLVEKDDPFFLENYKEYTSVKSLLSTLKNEYLNLNNQKDEYEKKLKFNGAKDIYKDTSKVETPKRKEVSRTEIIKNLIYYINENISKENEKVKYFIDNLLDKLPHYSKSMAKELCAKHLGKNITTVSSLYGYIPSSKISRKNKSHKKTK